MEYQQHDLIDELNRVIDIDGFRIVKVQIENRRAIVYVEAGALPYTRLRYIANKVAKYLRNRYCLEHIVFEDVIKGRRIVFEDSCRNCTLRFICLKRILTKFSSK